MTYLRDWILLINLCLMVLVIHARGAEPTSPGKEYIYKSTSGMPQAMEVYFPSNHDPANSRVPCLLLFHGGCWGNGDLSTFRYDCSYFASRGIVAATANYYMVSKEDRGNLSEGESRKQVCVTDAKSAIRWIKQHSRELGIDPNLIIVGGGSAGGHISILSTTNPGINDPKDPKEFDTSVIAYLLFNPALSEGDAKYPQINALNYLTSGFPPAVVFFGTEDKWKSGWDAAHNKLKDLGAADRIHVWLAEGESHAFFNKQPWKDITIIEADRFLSSLGLLQGDPTLKPPDGGPSLKRELP